MIQIKAAKNWGVQPFVNHVYWHKTPINVKGETIWGGVDENGSPLSNTKIWYDLHNKNKDINISKVFILGGGPITLEEFRLIKSLNIPFQYYPVERKYNGDGETLITANDDIKIKKGDTYEE